MITDFRDILAPVTPEEFFAEYYGKQALHIPGTPEKFASVMSWEKLNALLNMSIVWQQSDRLKLALDGKIVPPEAYGRSVARHANGATTPMWDPDPERVKAQMRQGASLVLDRIESLMPGLSAAAETLECALEAKVQANLYCSWKGHQAFTSHFDAHEVFALNMEGNKLWQIYEGRMDDPVEQFTTIRSLSPAFHERSKGDIKMEVMMRPGDVIYLPRGLYHDALAETGGCIHVTFSAVTVTGVDYASEVFKRAIADPRFRALLPISGASNDDAAYIDHLARLAGHLEDIAASNEMVMSFRMFQQNFRSHQSGYDLPGDVTGGPDPREN